MAPTIPVYTLGLPELLQQAAMEGLAAGALSRYRTDAARARTDHPTDLEARSATVVIGPGDSLTEAFAPTKREFMWTRYLARRLNRQRMGGTQYIPAATGTFSDTVAGSWPGGQAPWVYSVAPAADVTHGGDLHAVTMVSGSTATITFVGESINVVYTRTPGGPAAAAVTLDGAAQTAIAANGTELPGRIQTYLADGYGFHTLVITSTSGTLLLEGAVVTDNEIFSLGVPGRIVRTMAFGHAGFQTNDYIIRPNWSTSLLNVVANQPTGTYPSLFIIGLGANDQVGAVDPGVYANNLLSIITTIDLGLDALGITTDPGFLLLAFPTQSDAYVDQMWSVRNRYNPDRVAVLDLRRFMARKGVDWDIFLNASHMNDAGQQWVANIVAAFIEGFVIPDVPQPGLWDSKGNVYINALDPPDFRLNYAQSLALVSAANGTWRDATPASSTVAERRHRKWFNRGVYTPALRYGEVTTLGGEWQVLVNGTSLGTTGASTGTTGNIVGTALSSTITIDTPGPYSVTLRKTGLNAGAAHFVDCEFRKTA